MTRRGTRDDVAPQGVPDRGVEQPVRQSVGRARHAQRAQDDPPHDMEDPMSSTTGLPLANLPTGATSGKS